MTPEERASEFAKAWFGYESPERDELAKKLSAEMEAYASERVRAAVEEAKIECGWCDRVGRASDDWYCGKCTVAKAYEDAAKIAEEGDCEEHGGECGYSDCHRIVADLIRARKEVCK